MTTTACLDAWSVWIQEAERLYLDWIPRLSFNPLGTTPGLDIGGTVYPMTWVGDAELLGSGQWTQAARTTAMFIGSDRAVQGSDVQLPPGSYVALPLVTLADGQVVAAESPTKLRVS